MSQDAMQYIKDNAVKVGLLAVLLIGVIAVFIFNPFGVSDSGQASSKGGPGPSFNSTSTTAGKAPQTADQKKLEEQAIQQQQQQATELIKKKRPTGGS